MATLMRRRAARGFSLVEIMVGVTIGMIGMVVMFQAFAVSEGYRRTTTAGGDAQQSGSVALFMLEREIRQAGFGFNDPTYYGCQVNAYQTGTPARNFSFTLAPVVITPGAGGAPDSITVTYGNSSVYSNSAALTQNMATPTSALRVDNRYGFFPSDLVVLAETGKNCTLAELTSLPTVPGQTDLMSHDTGNYNAANGMQVASQYNPAGGMPAPNNISYTTNAKVFDLGPQPSNVIYTVQGGYLQMQSVIASSAASQPVVENIIGLQAQYGKDNGVNNGTVTNAVYSPDDGLVDSFDAVAPVTPTDWSRVIAIRLAVLARSGLKERPDATTGTCSTTAAAPAWVGGSFTVSGDPDWKCYRYRVYQTTVPVRNLIWKP